jgi:hypothetical protein
MRRNPTPAPTRAPSLTRNFGSEFAARLNAGRFARTSRLLPFLVAASVFLPGCPLHDDYSIDQGEPGGAQSNGGMAAGGKPDVSSSGRDGASAAGGTSAAGGASSAGGTSGAGDATGAGGAIEPGTTGCVAATNQGHEYAFCFDALTQGDARADCGERGMTLVVIEDQAEGAWIAKTFSEQYGGDSPRAFIGANDVTTEGEWHWADGTTFWRSGAAVSGRYTSWSEEEPNDESPFAGAADCLSIYFSDGTWADVSCEAEFPYVCEPR